MASSQSHVPAHGFWREMLNMVFKHSLCGNRINQSDKSAPKKYFCSQNILTQRKFYFRRDLSD